MYFICCSLVLLLRVKKSHRAGLGIFSTCTVNSVLWRPGTIRGSVSNRWSLRPDHKRFTCIELPLFVWAITLTEDEVNAERRAVYGTCSFSAFKSREEKIPQRPPFTLLKRTVETKNGIQTKLSRSWSDLVRGLPLACDVLFVGVSLERFTALPHAQCGVCIEQPKKSPPQKCLSCNSTRIHAYKSKSGDGYV